MAWLQLFTNLKIYKHTDDGPTNKFYSILNSQCWLKKTKQISICKFFQVFVECLKRNTATPINLQTNKMKKK